MADWNEDYDGEYDPAYDEQYDDGYDDGYDDDDDETATVRCGNCGIEVYEDAPQCPECGSYITNSTSPLAWLPQWVVVCGVIGMLLTAIALVMG